MTITLASQFHVYLPWVNACLESLGTFVWSSNPQCAQDPRIAVHVTPDSQEWELAISSASPGDSGLYECQVTAPHAA